MEKKLRSHSERILDLKQANELLKKVNNNEALHFQAANGNPETEMLKKALDLYITVLTTSLDGGPNEEPRQFVRHLMEEA